MNRKPALPDRGTRWELTDTEAEALQHEIDAARKHQLDGTHCTHPAPLRAGATGADEN